jgi:transcriptional regulator with XRE-family HTH domain
MNPPAPAGCGATGLRMTKKAEFAAWLSAAIAARGMNQSQVARALQVSRATLTRWTDADDTTFPSWQNVRALADVLNAAPPGGLAQPALAAAPVHGLEPMPETPGPDWNGNVSHWRVLDSAMQTKGYVAGDVVKADARITPVDGDVVVANVFDQGRARTVLRLYKAPGYVLPATADAGALEVHELGKTAALQGVVVEMTRRRPAH